MRTKKNCFYTINIHLIPKSFLCNNGPIEKCVYYNITNCTIEREGEKKKSDRCNRSIVNQSHALFTCCLGSYCYKPSVQILYLYYAMVGRNSGRESSHKERKKTHQNLNGVICWSNVFEIVTSIPYSRCVLTTSN